MNLAAIFTGSFTVALFGAVAPGPLLAISVERTVKRGFIAGPLLAAGHSILEAGIVILILTGFSEALSRPGVNYSVGLAGGMVLVFMGALMSRGGGAPMSKPGACSARGSEIWRGIAASLANPYWSIWWVSVGMAYMALALPRGAPGVAAFYAGHVSADFLWYSAVSFSVAKGKGRLSEEFFRKSGRACGVFLSVLGAWFIVRGVSGLLGMPG